MSKSYLVECAGCLYPVEVVELYNSGNEYVVRGYECEICGHEEDNSDDIT